MILYKIALYALISLHTIINMHFQRIIVISISILCSCLLVESFKTYTNSININRFADCSAEGKRPIYFEGAVKKVAKNKYAVDANLTITDNITSQLIVSEQSSYLCQHILFFLF